MRRFFVYMLRCADGSFYVGHTDKLEIRIAQHQGGEIKGYTSTRRPLSLVWSADVATRNEARERERQIKGWSRAKKEALIVGDWDEIHRLARTRSRPSTPRPPSRALRSGHTEKS